MQLIQKLKMWPQLLLLSMLLCVAQTAPVFASGDAYFTLSPASGSHIVGSTFSVTVYETSSATDNTVGVQANLSYNASLLQWESNSLGAFSTICGTNSGGGGSVNVACASSSTQNGTQVVMTISFKALASGTASVAMITGPGGTPTDIQNSSGSVWNGSLPGASFSLSKSSSSGSSGSTSHTSSGSTGSGVLSTTPSITSTNKPSTTSTAKPTTTTSTTPTTSTTTQPALAAVTIIVVDVNGQPIQGATVVLDGKTTMTTDSQGKANFPAESGGSHAVTITDPGKKPYSTKVSLNTGQSIPIEMQLTDAKSSSLVYVVIGIVILFALIGIGLWFFRSKLPWRAKPHMPVQLTPAPVAEPVTPSPAPVPRPTQPPSGIPSQSEERQTRSFYLRRRDSFDGIRGKH